MVARALVAIWRNRRVYPAGFFRNVLRVLIIVPLLLVLDLAMIVGTLKWVISDKLRLRGESVTVGHVT